MVDYEKWQKYDDECLHNEEDIKINFEENLKRITNEKQLADHLFEEAKLNKTLYLKSLELYLSIVNEILTQPQLSHFYISCQLNSAVCYIKLSKWNQCICICDTLLDMIPCKLTILQQIRCHYFRASSYYESSKNEISLRNALKSSEAIQNIIELSGSTIHIDEEDQLEYNLLHQKLTILLRDEREGWKLISQQRYNAALDWFNHAILANENSPESKDIGLLTSYYEGVGASYEGSEFYQKASIAYEKAIELKSTMLSTPFDELDLPFKNSFQRILLLSAHSSLRAALIEHSKDEFPVLIKQSAELFQRVIAFSARFSDSELYTFLSSLYVSLSHYGLACCYFYLNQHQLARESYEKAILYILKFFSTSPPFDSSPPQIAVSSQNILISDAILCQQESQLNYSPFLLQYDNIFSIFSTSMMKIFEICLPDRSVTTSLTTLSFHYSILFDAYNWSLFFNFRAQKYADLVIICDNFYCSIDKCVETISSFPQTQQTKESWALLQQLSVGNFVIKCMAYDQLNCIDLDIQDQNYSQLYHHTEELSKYLSSTVPMSVVGTFDSLTTWDCYHTFFLVTQYYFRRSKVLLFQLDDNILHNDNYELYDITQKVLEMSSRGIKEIEKYLRLLDIQLEKVTMESINFPSPSHDIGFSDRCLRLLFKYQDAYLHLLKLHLYRGLCAGDRIQGQRFFECGHGSREQYYRLRISEKYRIAAHACNSMNTPRDPSSGVDEDELDERIIWKNDCCRVSGDIAYHLAYTYMRSGKMKYAIEEARLASKFYSEMDDLPLGDPLSDENLIHSYNSNIESDKRIRLRHAWGLIAVITCNMGSNPEIQEECNHALQMVKELHIGPLQDTSMELERLQKILEFNKLKNTSTPPSINSPSYRLSETWNQTIQKEKEPIHETKIQSTNEPYTSVDYNLLLSYFILTTITAFLCYAFIGILF